MRYVITLLVLLSIGLIVYGFSLEAGQDDQAHRYIGSGTLLLFLVAMPLFLVTESRGKKWKDYMLTEDNVRKMQGKPPKNEDKS